MSQFIPLSVPNFGAREAALAGEAITSGWVSTSGGKVTEFEQALADYLHMPRAVACNAGSSALHLAAMAAGGASAATSWPPSWTAKRSSGGRSKPCPARGFPP